MAIVAGIMAMMSQQPSVAVAGDPAGFVPPPPAAPDGGFAAGGVWTGMPESGSTTPEPGATTPEPGADAGVGRAAGDRRHDVGRGVRHAGGRRVEGTGRGLGDRRACSASSSGARSARSRPDVRSVEIEVRTSDRRVIDVTEHVRAFAATAGSDGLLHVFVPHATAGVALMETGSGSEADLDELIERLLPRDDRYAHRHGSIGHGGDHLLPVLVSPSLTVPVLDGDASRSGRGSPS